jgi:hypothetical protein
MPSYRQRLGRLRAFVRGLASTKPGHQLYTPRLRRLHALVSEQAPTEWGRSYIEDDLVQRAEMRHGYCPRFAGIVEESGEQAVILAASEADLAVEMAGMFTRATPLRPVELVDLDTGTRRLAVCDAAVHFIAPNQQEQS